MLRRARPRGRVKVTVGLVAALAVVASACGPSTEDEVSTAAQDTTESSAGSPTESSTGDGDGTDEADAPSSTEGDDGTSAADDGASDEGDGEAEGEGDSDDAAAEAEPVENLFPNVTVVNLADQSEINLASELGGGDLPVLLWFWAPH